MNLNFNTVYKNLPNIDFSTINLVLENGFEGLFFSIQSLVKEIFYEQRTIDPY